MVSAYFNNLTLTRQIITCVNYSKLVINDSSRSTKSIKTTKTWTNSDAKLSRSLPSAD